MKCGQKLSTELCSSATAANDHDLWLNYKVYKLCSSEAIVAHNHCLQSKHYSSVLWNSYFRFIIVSNEQSGVDETRKFSQSIPHSSKMGSRSVLLYYITKTHAQCPVHISINGRLRYNYGSDTRNMVATISNSSCSVESTSVINPEKTGRVQKTFKRKRDREPSWIPLHRVIRLLKRRKCRKNIRYLVKHNFPSSSFFRDFCNNYKNWLIRYNCQHFYFKYVYFINK